MIHYVKELSNPISTGGLGTHFENRVQASFTVLLLARGYAPSLPNWPVQKIKLQGKYLGFETDDLIVFTQQIDTKKEAKLLGQIKHRISITKRNKAFENVMISAWKDFNNEKLFSEETDIIALICDPISAKDTDGVRNLINCAINSEDSKDFIDRVEKAKFTSTEQRNKFEVFKTHLKTANNDKELTPNELWRFLKIFRLLIYDLDIKGITLSLLHTIIEQHSYQNANPIWTQILDHVTWVNEQAGYITYDTIPDDIRSAFKKITRQVIPEELVKDSAKYLSNDFNLHLYANEISIMCLLGSWDENNNSDKEIVSKLAQREYNEFAFKLREILQLQNNPVIYQNGHWSLKERKQLLKLIGTRIFDDTLNSFKNCFVDVLKEEDPKFNLPIDSRFYASFHDKTPKHSTILRLGICQGLALIGNYSSYLTNCSPRKTESINILSIREVLVNADWKLWATLDRLLPLFAESAPSEYLKIIETSIQKENCPFIELFKQEGNGITGWNYMTGLLWSLETLAWEVEFFTSITMILSELHKLDPGGNWGNRPMNSLVSLYLPWFPQTTAPFEKRKIGLLTLKAELPDVALIVLTKLLPDKSNSSDNNYRPSWRNSIPENWNIKVSSEEYWLQIDFFVKLLLELSKSELNYTIEIINNLDNLPVDSFDALLEFLSSERLIQLPEDERYLIWTKLMDFIIKHKKYSYTDWALPKELIIRIEVVANKLSPKDLLHIYRRLFDVFESDFDDEKLDWQAQEKIVEEKRIQALIEILKIRGIEGIADFFEKVESGSNLGKALAFIDDASIDKLLFPSYIESFDNKKEQFISTYIWYKFFRTGWKWVDNLNLQDWSIIQLATFYSFLPFIRETWDHVTKDLSSSEIEYWKRVPLNSYSNEQDINIGIDKLLEYGRPNVAINYLYRCIRDKRSTDVKKITKALLLAASSKEPINTLNTHYTIELIKFLQENEAIDIDDLILIEWTYLQMLDRYHGAEAKTLENHLATNPSFFCEIIQLLYISTKADKAKVKQNRKNEKEKSIAINAWRLLNKWHTPPGFLKDGKFSVDKFQEWLSTVITNCTNSGHLEMALLHIGKVLIYCPPDNSGLWINDMVAKELNRKEFSDMRSGFKTALFNSRGAHMVDPLGQPERDLATSYRIKAQELDNLGYFRIANSLNELAKSYDWDADRIIEEHRIESIKTTNWE